MRRREFRALVLVAAIASGCDTNTNEDAGSPPAPGSDADLAEDAGAEGAVPEAGAPDSRTSVPPSCTAETVLQDCPSRPCEIATGCEAGACVYTPVTCNFDRCQCPNGQCTDDELRGCGDGVCPAHYCDPAPVLENGIPRYQNSCVAREDVRCGPCDLGSLACTPEGTSCDAIPLFGLDPAFVECNGAALSPTFVFLDVHSTHPAPDGSKEAPYRDLGEALVSAEQRNARGLVIGGSPELSDPVTMIDGLSIYGGFSAGPSFARDALHRPVFLAGTGRRSDGRLLGFSARDIRAPTALIHVEIHTAELSDVTSTATNGAGFSNIAFFISGSPGLILRDLIVRAGSAGHGADGADGTDGDSAASAQIGGSGLIGSVVDGSCRGQFSVAGGAGGAAPTCGGTPITSSAGGDGATTNTIFDPNWPTGQFWRGGDAPGGSLGGLGVYSAGVYTLGIGQDASNPLTAAANGTDRMIASGTFTGDSFQPDGFGTDGENGQSGGGGGGGGSGYQSEYNGGAQCRAGGSGGGGGAGGCGGFGGGGGAPGGWSFGLVIENSRGLSIDTSTITAGAGGDGGRGGDGGYGAMGSAGGGGGARPAALPALDAYDGASGGHGGNGQDGGRGGRGAPGRSIAVLFIGGES